MVEGGEGFAQKKKIDMDKIEILWESKLKNLSWLRSRSHLTRPTHPCSLEISKNSTEQNLQFSSCWYSYVITCNLVALLQKWSTFSFEFLSTET